MTNVRTFIDSNVLIAAARGKEDIAARAFAVLDDPDRVLITSDFIRLEVLPKARYHKQEAEAQFYDEFFEAVRHTVPASKELVEVAQKEAESAGLQAFDALHVAAACEAEADEFVTAEKPTKTVFRTRAIEVKTIFPAEPD